MILSLIVLGWVALDALLLVALAFYRHRVALAARAAQECCGRRWFDLDRHRQFAHGEVFVGYIDAQGVHGAWTDEQEESA